MYRFLKIIQCILLNENDKKTIQIKKISLTIKMFNLNKNFEIYNNFISKCYNFIA